MVKLKLIVERIEELRREVKAFQKLLLAKPIYLPFSPNLLLKLSLTQIHTLIALKLIGGEASATDVANVLGISRAMVSAGLNSLNRLGVVDKSRDHRIVVFRLKIDEP